MTCMFREDRTKCRQMWLALVVKEEEEEEDGSSRKLVAFNH